MLPCPQEPFLLSMYSKGNSRHNVQLKLKNTVKQENGRRVTLQYILRTNLWMAVCSLKDLWEPKSEPGPMSPFMCSLLWLISFYNDHILQEWI